MKTKEMVAVVITIIVFSFLLIMLCTFIICRKVVIPDKKYKVEAKKAKREIDGEGDFNMGAMRSKSQN